MSAITPNFAGELQFAGWTDSHTSGPKVTFWLQSAEDLEAFRSLTARKGNQAGHRFMAVFVEVGDDEKPVPPPTSKQPLQVEKPKGGPLSIEAAALCRNPVFWSFWGTNGEDEAAHSLRLTLGIKSRSELDHNEAAKEKFIKTFRGPFMKHMLARGKSNH